MGRSVCRRTRKRHNMLGTYSNNYITVVTLLCEMVLTYVKKRISRCESHCPWWLGGVK